MTRFHGTIGEAKNVRPALLSAAGAVSHSEAITMTAVDHTSDLPQTQPLKRCSRCQRELPATLEYFSPNKTRRNGLQSRCKACYNEMARERWRTDPDHKARALQYAREYKKKYPAKQAEYSRKRYKLVGSNRSNPHAEEIRDMYEAQRGLCYWCSTPVYLRYEVDHIIPIAQGGTEDLSNLVIACRACNRSKGDRLPWEWKEDWYVNLDW